MIYFNLTSDQVQSILAAFKKGNGGPYSNDGVGSKIAAIKLLKNYTNCGLLEAKDAVEYYLYENKYHPYPDSFTARIRETNPGVKLVGVTLTVEGIMVSIRSDESIEFSSSLGNISLNAEYLREILRHYDNTRM